MRKLTLNFSNSWTHGLVKVKVLGSEQPKGLITFGWSQPHCYAQPHSWCDTCWVCLGSSPCSSMLRSLPFCWGLSWLQKLNDGNTGWCEQGCPGPLAFMHCSVMAWVINCQPSHRLITLVLSWACLPLQLMAPNSVNMASHASPKLSPSPRDCLP